MGANIDRRTSTTTAVNFRVGYCRASGALRRTYVACLGALLIAGCAAQPQPSPVTPTTPTSPENDFGVLVMAHGGSEEWNAGVLESVEPLRKRFPIEVAFGMADAASLQTSVRKLEERGARKIAVVRLFVSGESWYERTEQILGIRAGAPARAAEAQVHAGHTAHAGHSMEFYRIDTRASFALSRSGLADAPAMGRVLAERARTLSKAPQHEDILILAHGPGDDAENARWLAKLDERAAAVRESAPFRRVEVATLREDWPEKREAAEKLVRDFVSRASAERGSAIVIPFRVHGFGPYESVFQGLTYARDGRGLIPHPAVTQWIEEQITQLASGPFLGQIPVDPAMVHQH